MTHLAYKGIGLILSVAILIGLGWHLGSQHATKEYLPQLAALQAVIEASDAQAHKELKEQEKNYETIKTKSTADFNRIIGHYDRLLREKREADSGTTPSDTVRTDGASGSCGASKEAIEFERGCALDAAKVLGFQEWVRANRIPVK